MKKKIKDIKIGDQVQVYNIKNKEVGVSIVTDLYRGQSDHYYLLNGSIKVTGEHPFYVRDKRNKKGFRWTKVRDLEPGDKLMKKNGKFSKVKSAIRHEEAMEIYNITVDGEHNYFAGGFLVHNKKGFGVGQFHGPDEDPSKTQSELNSSAESLNVDPIDTASTAIGDMVDLVTANSFAIGTANNLLNENNELIDPDAGGTGTGLYGDLIDSIKEAEHNRNKSISDAQKNERTTKFEGKVTAGDAFREQTKAVNAAKVSTGLVTAGERFTLDNEVELNKQLTKLETTAADNTAVAIEEADAEAAYQKQKALDALERAENEANEKLAADLAPVVDTHLDTQANAIADFNDKWKAGKDRMNRDSERKNYSAHVRPAGYNARSTALPKLTTPVPTAPEAKSATDKSNINPGASDNIVGPSFDFRDEQSLLDSIKWFGSINKPIGGAPEEKNEVTETIASIWKDSGQASGAGVVQITGPGQQTGVSNADGGNKDFVASCFDGETYIEVPK